MSFGFSLVASIFTCKEQLTMFISNRFNTAPRKISSALTQWQLVALALAWLIMLALLGAQLVQP